MRMWMVDPVKMCRKHLMGEHVELHMFVSVLSRNTKMDGYIRNNLIESSSIVDRHDKLAKEMTRRGYNHKSPLVYNDTKNLGRVDVDSAYLDLITRCNECKKLQEKNV